MKSRKLQVLETAKRSGLFDAARRRSVAGIRILTYHGIWTSPVPFSGDSMFMNAKAFERRLELIKEWGYPVITLDEAVSSLNGRINLPANSVVLTIDDGWLSTAQHMFPALKRHRMPATLYCDTAHLLSRGPVAHVAAMYFAKIARSRKDGAQRDRAAEKALTAIATDRTRPLAERLDATEKLAHVVGIDFDEQVRRQSFDYMTPATLAESVADSENLLSVELHTHNHTLKDMSREVIQHEIDRNRQVLSEILGRPENSFRHFAYPSGVFSQDAARILSTMGLQSATTTVQGIAKIGSSLFSLPRLCDNEMLTELEFEAELSGFADWMRRSRSIMPLPRLQASKTLLTDLSAVCALW